MSGEFSEQFGEEFEEGEGGKETEVK